MGAFLLRTLVKRARKGAGYANVVYSGIVRVYTVTGFHNSF